MAVVDVFIECIESRLLNWVRIDEYENPNTRRF